MSGPATAAYADDVRKQVENWPARPGMTLVYRTLHRLAQWRSIALAQTYLAQHGGVIFGGPFAGMTYDVASEGAQIARLLGTYESELHADLARFEAEGLDCVIDVGCAEGYYAVGLARRMPLVTVYAHDISDTARALCADLARRNGVGDRVIVGGEFKPQDFEAFAGRRALVLVDAEGAELDILQPDLSPALAQMNIIVETHDVFRPGALAELTRRFEPTHEIVRIDQQPKVAVLPDWLRQLSHLDQLLAIWEWRWRPTPWLVMRPRPS